MEKFGKSVLKRFPSKLYQKNDGKTDMNNYTTKKKDRKRERVIIVEETVKKNLDTKE